MQRTRTLRILGFGTIGALILLLVWVLLPTWVGAEPAEPEPATLEDLFGDTGNTFQAAVGLLNLEGQSGDLAGHGFGLAIDEFVTVAGPLRTFEIKFFNGPDMRWWTLEDIFGDTGNTFRKSLGVWQPGEKEGTRPQQVTPSTDGEPGYLERPTRSRNCS